MKRISLTALAFLLFVHFVLGQSDSITGYIIEIDRGSIYIDLSDKLVSVGDTLISETDEGFFIHPVTGDSIKKEGKEILLSVVNAYDSYAECKILAGEIGSLSKGMTIELKPSSSHISISQKNTAVGSVLVTNSENVQQNIGETVIVTNIIGDLDKNKSYLRIVKLTEKEELTLGEVNAGLNRRVKPNKYYFITVPKEGLDLANRLQKIKYEFIGELKILDSESNSSEGVVHYLPYANNPRDRLIEGNFLKRHKRFYLDIGSEYVLYPRIGFRYYFSSERKYNLLWLGGAINYFYYWVRESYYSEERFTGRPFLGVEIGYNIYQHIPNEWFIRSKFRFNYMKISYTDSNEEYYGFLGPELLFETGYKFLHLDFGAIYTDFTDPKISAMLGNVRRKGLNFSAGIGFLF